MPRLRLKKAEVSKMRGGNLKAVTKERAREKPKKISRPKAKRRSRGTPIKADMKDILLSLFQELKSTA